MPQPTLELVRRAQEGDREAYDELFAGVWERLHLFLRLRTGAALRQNEDSLDMLQETYLAAHRAFADYLPQGPGSFLAWLCRIGENCIRARLDHHGAARRQAPDDHRQASQLLEKLRTRSLGPATCAERLDQRASLTTAMLRLPDDERQAILMRFFEGRKVDEIADRLGISPSSARRLLGRATVLLGADLAQAMGGDDV